MSYSDGPDRQPRPRVLRALAFVVLRDSTLEVPRAADVERPVGAFEDVHVRHGREHAALVLTVVSNSVIREKWCCPFTLGRRRRISILCATRSPTTDA